MGKYTTMNLKNIPINPKKIPYYLSLLFLTLGASIILGFLSFGGMFALFPILSLAFTAFGLSVAYEGEILLQNIKGALNKLLNPNYLKNHLAQEYLLHHFPKNTKEEGCPQFFRDYEIQLKLLSTFNHKHLNRDSKKRKKQIETTLKDMEKWFALQLFSAEKSQNIEQSTYAKELHNWLVINQQEEWQTKLETRKSTFRIVKAFSLLAGAFMSLGTTYLIVEAFSVIPFFAAIPFAFLPVLVLPMALIAGTAYGLLTYNAVTDMINNDTLKKWYNKLRADLSQGLTVRNVFMTTTAVLLVALAVTLTVFTAGTWWTVATNARPLFEWMKKMPGFVMGVINPIITGLSAIFFNIQNTAESMDMIDQATHIEENIFRTLYNSIRNGFNHLRETENWLQILNPFRIVLKLTVTPLRILLFFGHLMSIALTADRMPGVPQIVAALISMISEGFEDAHYFIGHDDNHEHNGHHHHHDTKTLLSEHLDSAHGHNHNVDIPTLILKTLAYPLYFLAASWDWGFSQKNTQSEFKSVLSFSKALNKHRGIPEEQEVQLKSKAKRPSEEWQVEHTVSLIEKYKTKHFKKVTFGGELVKAKIGELNQLQKKISTCSKKDELAAVLNTAKDQPEFINQHRLFAQKNTKTNTQIFLEALPDRVSCSDILGL